MNPLVLVVALCLVFVAQARVEEPPNSGVYVKVADQWRGLEPIRAAGGIKHLTRVVVPGQPPRVIWVFRNPHASIKILRNSAELFVRDVPNFGERDVLIVKFDVKKDRRELQTIPAGNLSAFKSGFSRKRTPEFETPRYPIMPSQLSQGRTFGLAST